MPNPEWSDALALDRPEMDDTHREFVDLLAHVEAAPDDALLNHWRTLVDPADEHFGRATRWVFVVMENNKAATNAHAFRFSRLCTRPARSKSSNCSPTMAKDLLTGCLPHTNVSPVGSMSLAGCVRGLALSAA